MTEIGIVEKFFSLRPYRDVAWSRGLMLLLIITIIGLSVYVFGNVRQTLLILFYWLMITVTLIFFFADWIFDYLKKDKEKMDFFMGLGSNIYLILMATIVGLLLGYFFVISSPFTKLPLFTAIPHEIAGMDKTADITYRTFNMPTTEELFFRLSLLPALATAFVLIARRKNWRVHHFPVYYLLATFIVNGLFGLAHLTIFGNPDMAIQTIFWGVLVSLLIFGFKSAAIAIAMHVGNNLPFILGVNAAGLVIGGIIIVLIMVLILRFWIKRRKTPVQMVKMIQSE